MKMIFALCKTLLSSLDLSGTLDNLATTAMCASPVGSMRRSTAQDYLEKRATGHGNYGVRKGWQNGAQPRTGSDRETCPAVVVLLTQVVDRVSRSERW